MVESEVLIFLKYGETVADQVQRAYKRFYIARGVPVPSAANGTIASGSVNTIHENKILVDPLDKGDLIHVVGTVSFAVHELPILSRDEVRAEITLNGQAFSSLIYGPEDWPIDGNSTQVLDIGLKEQKRVEQTYAIRGYFEPLSLHISYLVTNTEVKVERLWLAPADAAANQ